MLSESCIIFSKRFWEHKQAKSRDGRRKQRELFEAAPSSIYYFSAVYLYDQLIFLRLNVLKIAVNSKEELRFFLSTLCCIYCVILCTKEAPEGKKYCPNSSLFMQKRQGIHHTLQFFATA